MTMCQTSDGIEDTEHVMCLCPLFDDLLTGVVELLRPVVQIAHLSIDALTQLLLYGIDVLSNNLERGIRNPDLISDVEQNLFSLS